jgi:hypothetical protein
MKVDVAGLIWVRPDPPGRSTETKLSSTAFPLVRAAEDAGFEPARASPNPLSKSVPGGSVNVQATLRGDGLRAWQPIMAPAERWRMRLNLRLETGDVWPPGPCRLVAVCRHCPGFLIAVGMLWLWWNRLVGS